MKKITPQEIKDILSERKILLTGLKAAVLSLNSVEEAARKLLERPPTGKRALSVNFHYNGYMSVQSQVRQQIDSLIWRKLFRKAGLTGLMDHSEYSELTIVKNETVVVSGKSIKRVLTAAYKVKHVLHRKFVSVVRSYSRLPFNQDVKAEIPGSLTLYGAISSPGSQRATLDARVKDFIAAIESDVFGKFCELDKPLAELILHETKPMACPDKATPYVVKTDYVTATILKKGNIRFDFKDQKILDGLNKTLKKSFVDILEQRKANPNYCKS